MSLTLVVAGVPRLAQALQATRQFAQVHSVGATSGLKDLIAQGLLKGSKDNLVFVFGDTLVEDTPGTPLTALLLKLTTSGWKVVVVGLSQRGRELVKAYPAAGLLLTPFTLNQAIGAVDGLHGGGAVGPVEDGFDILDLDALAAPTPTTSGGWPAAAQPAPVAPPAPVAAPAPVAPPAAQAPVQQAAPATGWATPAAGWATPAEPEPLDTPPARRMTPPIGAEATAPRRMAPPVAPTQAPAPAAQPAPANGWATPPTDWENPPALDKPATPEPAVGPVGGAQGGGFASWPAPTTQPIVPVDQPTPDVAATRRLVPPGPAPVAPTQPPFPPAFGQETGAGFNNGGFNNSGFNTAPVARSGYGPVTPRSGRRGHVTTITAPKGGTGKSSLTLNLATYLGLRLRSQGKRVCVIDANFQQADTGKYLDVYSPNIANIVRDQTALDPDRIEEFLIHRPDLGVHALLGPSTPMDANPVFINAKLYVQVLEVLRELYDYILIDTPVAEKFHDIFAGFALPQADYIIVPVAPNIATLMNADSWLQAITASRHIGGDEVSKDKIGIVLNRAKDNIDCDEDDVRMELARWTFIGAIPETDEWQRCNNNNELVATKNYTELNEAFSRVLYAATGEEVLIENHSAPAVKSGGLGSRLARLVKRG